MNGIFLALVWAVEEFAAMVFEIIASVEGEDP
jgi:hypothetical protein